MLNILLILKSFIDVVFVHAKFTSRKPLLRTKIKKFATDCWLKLHKISVSLTVKPEKLLSPNNALRVERHAHVDMAGSAGCVTDV